MVPDPLDEFSDLSLKFPSDFTDLDGPVLRPKSADNLTLVEQTGRLFIRTVLKQLTRKAILWNSGQKSISSAELMKRKD